VWRAWLRGAWAARTAAAGATLGSWPPLSRLLSLATSRDPLGAERAREQSQAWRKITDAVHERGSVIFLQLWHQGRQSHSNFRADGSRGVAPSPIAIKGMVSSALLRPPEPQQR
jgi:hypothetical protein